MHVTKHIFLDADIWRTQAAATIADAIRHAVRERGRCSLGLSGGSTPIPVYRALASEDIDWSAVTVFLADERMVPPTDPESNRHLVQTELLDHLTDPPACVFPDTALPPAACADAYDRALQDMLATGGADVLVLGMGPDGHTASLFPPVSSTINPDHFAIHTQTDSFAVCDRISVTPRVLQDAHAPIVLLKGTEKLALWRTMTEAPYDPARRPLQSALIGGNAILLACP